MRRGRKILYWFVLVAAVYTVFELASSASLLLLKRWRHVDYAPAQFSVSRRAEHTIERLTEDKARTTGFDSVLGWVPKPSRTTLHDKSRNRSVVTTIGPQRTRGKKTYSVIPRADMTRIAAFGDSYTFGAVVSDDECWAAKLDAEDARVEVLNFGVGGYGLDQAYLRYEKEGVRFSPHIVLICYLTENIARHVNVYRPFYSRSDSWPFSKPRFILVADTLKLLNNPLSTPRHYEELVRNPEEVLARLGKHDYFYQKSCRSSRLDFLPSVRLFTIFRHNMRTRYSDNTLYEGGYYNVDSKAFHVTVKLIDRFYERVRINGAIPVVLIFPHENDLVRYSSSGTKSYLPLLDYLRRRQLRHIDVVDAFDESGRVIVVRHLFNIETKGHYSPLGNELVAKYLFKYLKHEGLLRDRILGTSVN